MKPFPKNEMIPISIFLENRMIDGYTKETVDDHLVKVDTWLTELRDILVERIQICLRLGTITEREILEALPKQEKQAWIHIDGKQVEKFLEKKETKKE